MHRWYLAAFGLALALTACAPKMDDLKPGEKGRVESVLDPDTLALESGLKVHLTGIEGPHRDWPLATEARAAAEKLLGGRAVELRYGGAPRLEDGSALAQAFVTTETGRVVWVQEALVREGWARAHSWKDNQARADLLLAAEAKARAEKRGIWADPFYAIERADAVSEVDRYAIVEGRIVSVADSNGRTYLNFGEDYRTDFTIAIAADDTAAFAGDRAPQALAGKMVRVRGYVRERGGPLMQVDHPAQIELLKG